jgi:hypothetical protein
MFLQPTATTLTTGGSLVGCIVASPQSAIYRSDAFTFRQGKTGTTNLLTLDVSGNAVLTGNLRVNGNVIQSSTGATAVTLSGANVTVAGNIVSTAGNISTTVGAISANGAFDSNQALSSTANLLDTNTAAGSSIGIATNYWTSSAKTTLSVPQTNYKLGNFRFNSYSDTAGTFALGAQVYAEASENWTGSANGSRIVFAANKLGQSWSTGHQAVILASPDTTSVASDTITLESSAGNDYLVLNGTTATLKNTAGNPLPGGDIVYDRTYASLYNSTAITPVAALTVYTLPINTVVTAETSNVTISGTGTITIPRSGPFRIHFTCQISNSDNGAEHEAYFWLRKNGADVANTLVDYTIIKNGYNVASVGYIVSSDGNDEFEIMYAVSNTALTFPAIAANANGFTHPAAPPVIANVIPLGA